MMMKMKIMTSKKTHTSTCSVFFSRNHVLLAILGSIILLIRPMFISAATYSCPGLNADPVFVQESTSGPSFTHQINKSASNTVCVLLRIAPGSNSSSNNNNGGVNLNTITRESSNHLFDIVPVARSYNNRNWERVAGPYATQLQISGCCTVDIPNTNTILGQGGGGGGGGGKLLGERQFILLSFTNENPLSSKEEISRFFQQTTFGPTLSMINSWNYNRNMEYEMAKWVQDQIDTTITPATYHREYFRERVDFSTWNEGQQKFYRPRYPCAKYARWREFSITNNDLPEILSVSRWNGQFLLSFGGVPRTVVSTWKYDDDETNIGIGDFIFCHTPEERLNGYVYISRNGQAEEDCKSFLNPAVNLPSAVRTSEIKSINLPNKSNNFGSIQPIPFQGSRDDYYGEAIYLKNDISANGRCSNIANDGIYSNVLGTFPNGKQAWYAGHLLLEENTLEDPISDGGAAMISVNPGEDGDEPICPVTPKSFVNIDSCYLSTQNKACSNVYTTKNSDHVVVCGSPGEKANNPLTRNTFAFFEGTLLLEDSARQKKDASNAIFLESSDQLRQRVAFALSQILVVTPNQINESGYSEIYLNYFDIFVRHAFGNYFDILKEVAYSPMMAEMLSYLNSRSSVFVLDDSGSNAYPDENFAREIMQLFSIGLYELNMDGTKKFSGSSPILTYSNADIQNFARAWTGFVQQKYRANFEMDIFDENNRIDPMRIEGIFRDPYPKTDLHGGYIGDKVPLCEDLPNQHFLKKGATYQLLGSSLFPDLHEYREEPSPNVLNLALASSLRSKLSTKEQTIVLDETIPCNGNECNVDTLRLVQIQSNPNIYYEYARQPCVEMPFYDSTSSKKISTGWLENKAKKSMCANQNLHAAYDACCEDPSVNKPWARPLCYYDFEKTKYSTARSRCQNRFSGGDTCDFHWVDEDSSCETANGSYWAKDNWYWTNESCTVKVKVNDDGLVALVHVPTLQNDNFDFTDSIDLRVHPDNTFYFKVIWESNSFPNSSNSCGNGACQSVYRGCLCTINVVEGMIFSSLPSEKSLLEQAHIGAIDPNVLGGYNQDQNGNIVVWHKSGGYDKDTIFQVNYRGRQTFLKNMYSTIEIVGATRMKFRNSPSYMNLAYRLPRDAAYETDAVLENYFRSPSAAPFLAKLMIQRFGISNPSPNFVLNVAIAFRDGTYSNPDPQGDDFGDGRYGSMEAMIAAIILDPEARSAVLDADPTNGSLVEPLLKFIRFMRAMEFQTNEESGERIRLINLQGKIGQETHSMPNVFSFFLPGYSSPGLIKSASLTAPEAQVLSGPKVISFLNGIISLVDLGLNHCFAGLGEEAVQWCDGLESYYDTSGDDVSYGKLTFQPSNLNNAGSVVDELSLLLTAGRLSTESRNTIINAYQSQGNNDDALRIAQKLLASTPEFHSTTLFNSKTESRAEIEAPQPSNKGYKAVIFLMLDGGSDSHNMIVPHSGCSGGKTSYNHYASVRGEIAIPFADLREIDASGSGQVCSKWGIHPNLPHLKTLYDSSDLLWIMNMGVLQNPVNILNWEEGHDKTALFAHNIQYEEVHKMDVYDEQTGRGVVGRMADILGKRGFLPGTVSVNGIANALVSGLISLFVVDPTGLEKFNPIPWSVPLWDTIKQLNKVTKLGSNFFGETWSNILFKAVGENRLVYDSLKSTSLSTSFPDNDLGMQMELIAKMIKTKDSRGVDRDMFYAEIGGFDTHSNIKPLFDERTQVINSGIEAFTKEMKAQNTWNDVTIVMVSEFARTLTGNTGKGSDHAWGGNYWIAGGEVRGKRIIGEYPTTLDDGNLIFEPGIVIPSTPWDALWNGIAQWFGITNVNDLNELLPNRNKFASNLFNENQLYTTGSTPTAPTPTVPTPTAPTPTAPTPTAPTPTAPTPTAPTPTAPTPTAPTPTAPTPTAPTPTAPTPTSPTPPTSNTDCSDSPLRFRTYNGLGRPVWRGCDWVGNKKYRCDKEDLASHCRLTCGKCGVCDDSYVRFKVVKDGKRIARDCGWVENKQTIIRCGYDGVAETCPETCNSC